MARVPKIRDFSQDEIMAALTPPASTFDSSKITQAVTGGLDLAETIRARKQAQEDRERKLAQEIEKVKRQKQLAEIAKTAAPQANISPELAEAATLEAPDQVAQQVANRLFAEKKQPAAYTQRKRVVGTLEDGTSVEEDFFGNRMVGEETYDVAKHGRIFSTISKEMTGEEVNRVADAKKAVRALERVEESFSKNAVGLVDSALTNVARTTGLDLRDLSKYQGQDTEFRTNLALAINNYIRAITGAQMGEKEADRIKEALPIAAKSKADFIPALQTALQAAREDLDITLETMEIAGRGRAGSLREPSASSSASKKLSPGRKTSKGYSYTVEE